MTRDIVRASTGTGIGLMQEMQFLIYEMRWLILFCVILILADLKFGIENSEVHGEKIRRSRAIRRTVNKFIDYLCWLMFAGIFGKAFAPHFGWETMFVVDVVMIVACLAEIDSVVQNFCGARGIEFSFRKFLVALVSKKSKDVADALDETIKKDDDETE